VTQEQIWDYNPNGKIQKYQLIVNGQLSTSQLYYYSRSGDIDSIRSFTGGETWNDVYTYEDGKLKVITTFTDVDEIFETKEYSYTSLVTTIERRDPDGILLSTTEITNNERGQEITWQLRDADGIVTIKRTTEYDQKGNIITVTDDYAGFGTYKYTSTWKC
jgi:antitoxin component YwqK of YwqJK toxin-antitoxin module